MDHNFSQTSLESAAAGIWGFKEILINLLNMNYNLHLKGMWDEHFREREETEDLGV